MDSSHNTTYYAQAEFDRSLLRAIHEASPDAILVVNKHAEIVSYNQRFIDTWKLDPEHVLNSTSADGTIPEQSLMRPALSLLKYPEEFIERVQQLYAHPEERDYAEIELVDGRVLERHSVGLYSDGGRYIGRVWFFRDITERKKLEAELRQSAHFDPLTGELNRRHFLHCAEQEFERAQRFTHPLSFVMLDLDFFKQINDQYGHATGDWVLTSVCKRWRSVLRSPDLLGRIGGEEFAVVLPEITPEKTRQVVQRLCEVISELPFVWEQTAIMCTVSCGATSLRADDTRVQALMQRADEALYSAKDVGRNRISCQF